MTSSGLGFMKGPLGPTLPGSLGVDMGFSFKKGMIRNSNLEGYELVILSLFARYQQHMNR
jgi:hypothetical protein